MLKRLFLIAATAGLMSAPAAALNFDNYCVGGMLGACASVRVQSVFEAGQWHLKMQVWNLEGTYGQPHTLTAIGLYHYSPANVWGGSTYSVAATYVGGTDPGVTWDVPAPEIGTLAGAELEIALHSTSGGNDGIIGCTDPGGVNWQTCNSFPGTPYVEFDFSLGQHEFSLDNVALRWHSQQTSFDYMGKNLTSLKCDTYTATEDYPPCEIVPEPISMVLLGTGLAGVGGVGILRRRRRGVDVVDG